MRRRALAIGASLAMFVMVLMLGRMAAAPSMALLYSGLEANTAGEIVAALESRDVAYEIKGTAIHVPSDQRDALRLELAAEGLPSQGGAGYELLDSLSGFGTTAQMFDAAWSRAVEGELARTILANPQIRAARVHIARGSDRPFDMGSAPSASVFVTTAGGLSPAQARALRHLVASAITGLSPDKVAVIDAVQGLIPVEDGGLSQGNAADRATAIRQNVERLLAARVGPGRAVVEVSVDLVTESELLSERRIDPQGRVATSTETESSSGSENQAGGEVTVASNLPDGDAGSEAGTATQSQESRERVDYELSETRREVTRVPGDIRRLSVAVLVDGERIASEDGSQTWQPRSDEELSALRELVASAAGIDESRGDVLTLKSLEIVAPQAEEATAPSDLGLDLTRIAGFAILAAVVLAIALFVLRPALRQSRSAAPPALPLPPMMREPRPLGPVLTGEIADGVDTGDLPVIGGDRPAHLETEDPVSRLRRMIGERQTESLEILKTWMDADGGRA
ncbi:flagellar basal-body MS-ring/collar protein FliF [Paragemmobacter ruber]|nr:flagellar basal-body MS-ring/collar protein FliF [Rhodobacter ruber]